MPLQFTHEELRDISGITVKVPDGHELATGGYPGIRLETGWTAWWAVAPELCMVEVSDPVLPRDAATVVELVAAFRNAAESRRVIHLTGGREVESHSADDIPDIYVFFTGEQLVLSYKDKFTLVQLVISNGHDLCALVIKELGKIIPPTLLHEAAAFDGLGQRMAVIGRALQTVAKRLRSDEELRTALIGATR